MTDTVDLANMRVVICEDEGIAVMQLEKALKLGGLEVAGRARTGVEAVEVVLRERPDLVLMDIQMTDKMSGIEATRRILQEYSPCIVMLTAYSDKATVQAAMDAGAAGYMVKPIQSAAVVKTLEAAVTHSPHCHAARDKAVVRQRVSLPAPSPAE